jgi:hypothetical protein
MHKELIAKKTNDTNGYLFQNLIPVVNEIENSQGKEKINPKYPLIVNTIQNVKTNNISVMINIISIKSLRFFSGGYLYFI